MRAPDTIWIDIYGYWSGFDPSEIRTVIGEYTRTDLSQASVAAALEAAACKAEYLRDVSGRNQDGDFYVGEEAACFAGSVADEIVSEIRALITPAQHDALQVAIDAAKAKARAEDAAKIAKIADGYDEGGDRAIATGIRTVLAAIYQIGAKP